MKSSEAEGNFITSGHHCPTPDALVRSGPYRRGDNWACWCGQVWRVYEYGTKWVLWERN